MAALVAAIHIRDLAQLSLSGIMDGRDKPGHDEVFYLAALRLRGSA
jgi:hypothetical protein